MLFRSQISKEQVSKALEEMGVSQTIRGEAFTLAQFAEFSNILKNQKSK